MPIYEYACSCGARFEELVIRSSDADEVTCRSCGSRDVTRQISRPAASPSSDGGGSRSSGGCGPVG